MSENSNISTLVLKNDSYLSKKKDNKYVVNANNTISQPKSMEIISEQKEYEFNNSFENKEEIMYGFGIGAHDLEKIISKYKERGIDYQDLKYFEDNGGPEKLFEQLKTDTEKGISNTEGREEFFGSNKVFVEEVPHFCMFVWESFLLNVKTFKF